jgi:RimJ/RimL family protein N-acetyltransferase
VTSLRTSRLRLRTARSDDVEALHAILSLPDATRYWSTPPHPDLARTRAWVEAMIDIPAGEGEDFVVEYEGRVIGKAGLYRFPEIGFILHPDVWGLGLAGEAVAAVLARAFEVHGLDAVVADVDPRNTACLRLLAHHGFEETGRRERSWLVGKELCDSVDLALSRDAWRAARS